VQQRFATQIRCGLLGALCALALIAGAQAKKPEATPGKGPPAAKPDRPDKPDKPAKSEAPQVADPAESAYLTYDYIFVDSREIEAYLQGMMRRLLAAQGVKLDVPDILIRSCEAFDIFTDANRNIVVSTALLREVGSEDELAAALAHELSHQILKHPQRKNAARAFPMGLETVSLVKTAANRSQGASRTAYSGNLNNMGQESLPNTQAASLIWSDILAPGWNRKQERAADQTGFELMRAAGYDPSAFGALFQKLHAAQGKRSERLELLKKVMLAKAKSSKPKKSAKPASEADKMADDLKNTLTEGAAEAIVAGLASFNRDYDSPDERQRLLAAYAREHRQKKLSTVRPVRRYKEVLRQGAGARVLAADAAAVQTLNALTSKNMTGADKAVQGVLPKIPYKNLAAPHLNLAAGAWHHVRGRPQVGEQYANAWLAAKRPPAQAYVWVAYYQATRKEFTRAIGTLEQGRKRVGNSAPFLPHLVSLARAAGQKTKAEGYAVECLEEDQKNMGTMMANMVRGQQVPSGLYADCVRRLGHEPQAGKDQNAAFQAIKHPVETTKSLSGKIRDKFRRNQ
jgi:Zn-dependent protease with chaperone function